MSDRGPECKLENEIILSHIHEISPNGKILRDLVFKNNLSVINATDFVKGHLQRQNTSERSAVAWWE